MELHIFVQNYKVIALLLARSKSSNFFMYTINVLIIVNNIVTTITRNGGAVLK